MNNDYGSGSSGDSSSSFSGSGDGSGGDASSGDMCEGLKPIDVKNADQPGAMEYDTAIDSSECWK